MKILNNVKEVLEVRKGIKDKSIGLIHLSGNLHPGSVQVVRKLCAMCNVRFATIFLNPTIENFGEIKNVCEDCRKSDLEMLEAENIDYLFCPDVEEIFPPDSLTEVIPEKLIEKFSDFKSKKYIISTATLFFKLLNLIQPDFIFVGQKNFIDLFIVKQLVKDYDMDVNVVISPTLRNEKGIPYSSELKNLSTEDEKVAISIYNIFSEIREKISSGEKSVSNLKKYMEKRLKEIENFKIVKSEILNLNNFENTETIEGETVLIVLGEINGKKYSDAIFLKSKT